MSTSITWPPIGGTSYSVPASGETNWPALSNFLIALAAAQGTTAQKIGVRTATTSPVTVVSATDCLVVVNRSVAGATSVVLPAGVSGQQFIIIDGKGDAATNNITITANGAETINGAASFIINGNRSGVAIAFTGSGNWTVLSQSGGASINVDYIDFSVIASNPAFKEGRLFYDNSADTLSFYNAEADVTLNIGEENWIKVRNSTGSTITNGSAVYINGATGQNPTVALARANAAATGRTIGLATHDIENNTVGYVTVFGLVRDINTGAYADGDILYLSAATPGALTATAPAAPNFSVVVGVVAYSHAVNGKILCDPTKSLLLGFGTANQVLGMTNAATGPEYKSIVGTTDEIIVTHSANTITIDADATAVGTPLKIMKRDSAGGTAVDYLDQDGLASFPTYAAGRMWYDTVDNTMRYYNDSTVDSVNIGQEINVKVRNNSGSGMTAGQVVYVTGAIGGLPTVALARSNAFATSRVFAVITETIANNANGYATINGLIKNLNLSAFTDGDQLYLSSSVAGALQNTRPAAPNYVMPIGSVASNNSSTGRLIVELVTLRKLGFGAANQILGMNSGGTEEEYKTVSGTSGQVSALQTVNGLQLGLDSVVTPNYILNGSFEQTVNAALPAGWLQYNDGSVAIPVDGTGGSAVSQVTFLGSSSSPIRGGISAVLTKDAANRQGAGYSYDFTIAATDKSKAMEIQTELTVGSGTYAAGDLAFYVIDVTNTVVITPTVAAIPNTTGKWVISFSTTTATSYRLCIHIASTSAVAYTMKFDTMSVDAGVVTQGAAISEWQTYTPTFTGFGTPTAVTFASRRVGSNLEIQGIFTGGTSTGVEARVSVALGSTTLTVDSTTISSGSNSAVGTGSFSVASSLNLQILATGGQAYLKFGLQSTADAGLTAKLGNTLLSSGQSISFFARIPIAEWAGNGTVNLGPGAQVEYASNSDASNANDTTSFAYGPVGSLFPSVATSAKTKRIRFQSPIQSDDMIRVELSKGGGPWIDLADGVYQNLIGPLQYQNTNTYGLGLDVTSINTTDVDVVFGIYAGASGATYAAAGSAWSSFTTYKWRVRKVKASSPVGFGLADTAGQAGLVNPYLVGSGVVYSGSYTPTITNDTNATTITAIISGYSRIGNRVTVYGAVTLGSTAANTQTTVTVSLPVPSNFTLSTDSFGVGSSDKAVGAVAYGSWQVSAKPSSSTVYLYSNVIETTVRTVAFSFMYLIK